MLLSEPRTTAYDINFSIFGFAVRVHPAFFILPIWIGQGFTRGAEVHAVVGILIVIAAFFLSILVHELGHTLAFRWCGIQSRIVLHWMGGIAIPERGWGSSRRKSLTPNEQIFVSFAGPLAGLLLAAVFVGGVYATGFAVQWGLFGPIPIPRIDWGEFRDTNPTIMLFVQTCIIVNIILNVFNLLPVYPLDGGQIMRQLFVKMDPWSGIRNSLFISIAVALFMGVLGIKNKEMFLAFFFGYMAYSNYMMLQSGPQSGKPW